MHNIDENNPIEGSYIPSGPPEGLSPCLPWLEPEQTVPKVVETDIGKLWIPTYINDPIPQIIRSGWTFELEIVSTCLKYITPGCTVIDVGANLGQMSLHWSRATGPTGRVHAFECSKFMLWFLNKTIQENNITNITIHEQAVWDRAGIQLQMLMPDGTEEAQFYSGMGVKGEGDTRKLNSYAVTSTTIDSYEYETPVKVIKIDIQGADLHAVRGAEKTLIKHRPLLVFEHEPYYDGFFKHSLEDTHAWLNSLGYVHRLDLNENTHDRFYTYGTD